MSDTIPSGEKPVLSPADAHEQVATTDTPASGILKPATDVPASDPEVPATPNTETMSSVILPADLLPSTPNDIPVILRQLAKDFATKLKYDASKQELIDKLYKENMEFKEGIVKKFQHTMILAVIEKIDESSKEVALFEKREFTEENYRKLLDSYNDITAGFQNLLSAQFDVECYSSKPLTGFDPKTQRSLKTSPTDEADKNKLVKQTLRPGYKTIDGFILRPELVEVYVFDEKR